jgi:hypothetical protein
MPDHIIVRPCTERRLFITPNLPVGAVRGLVLWDCSVQNALRPQEDWAKVFAKIFGQIFDSSLADDFNCRCMFMDLLVLADRDGIIDMTTEAISRRTNRPIEMVERYIGQLCEPDPHSRCPDCEGRRLLLLDGHRNWGWRIVNYAHYRNLRNDEARREYFREAQRSYRKKLKDVKDMSNTNFDSLSQSFTSASVSVSVLKEGVRGRFLEWMKFRRGMGKKPSDWVTLFNKQAQWLLQFSEEDQIEILNQSMRNGWQGLFEPKRKKGWTPMEGERESKLDREMREARKRVDDQKRESG